MSQLAPLEKLLVKQTCRIFAQPQPESGITSTAQEVKGQQQENAAAPRNIYSPDFLRSLYECQDLSKPLELVVESVKKDCGNGCCCHQEKIYLLEFFHKVSELKSEAARQWNYLQHYLCFVYRHCMTCFPDPEQQVLSPYFLADMEPLVSFLMIMDQVQLCLRLFSLVREYTVMARKQHQTITEVVAAVESLFYYYEAFLSATKNICKIFPELEQLLLNTYKLGWLDFNTSIFMYYFYETPYVQKVIQEFEKMKDSEVSIKAAGIYTVLTELHKLWRSQMLGINGVIASKLGAQFKGLDNKMMSGHKKILATNYWIDRTRKEIDMQDLRLFDCQLFSLVGNKNLALPEPMTDETTGECICEECLVIKYHSMIVQNGDSGMNNNNISRGGSMVVSCRFCMQLVELDQFQDHVVGRVLNLDGSVCTAGINSNINPQDAIARTAIKKHHPAIGKTKRTKPPKWKPAKEPVPKLASEPPSVLQSTASNPRQLQQLLESPDGESEDRGDPEDAKTFSNMFKCIRKILPPQGKENAMIAEDTDLRRHDTRCDSALDSSTTTAGKARVNGNPQCGHSCKLEKELKSEFKKAYQDTCDHHKESKKCDCTFCEVFGTTSPHVHKTNETRNRLRIRLNQRNENVTQKTAPKPVQNNRDKPQSANKTTTTTTTTTQSTPPPPAAPIKTIASSDSSSLTTKQQHPDGDIHGLLSFIEGHSSGEKQELAEKKAAKKARQRNKKEQERLQLEAEARKKEEEERKLLEQKRKSEELERTRQLEEKSKQEKKEAKKLKQRMKRDAVKVTTREVEEETIPAMVTIKRVAENNALPTVTITLKGSTPDQDKLLYTLVNGGSDDKSTGNNNKKNNKKEQEAARNKNANKNKSDKSTTTIMERELKVTLAVDGTSSDKKSNATTKTKQVTIIESNNGKSQQKSTTNNKSKTNSRAPIDLSFPLLKLPPDITITKINGPITNSYKGTTLDSTTTSYCTTTIGGGAGGASGSNIPVSKSGVIVVDTEKLIKQSSSNSGISNGKKNKKKRNKAKNVPAESAQRNTNNKSSMVTLKNPIFQNMQPQRQENPVDNMLPDLSSGSAQYQQASIFKNENGMVTIRSSRLQQSLMTNGTAMPTENLKPVMGPNEVPTSGTTYNNFSPSSQSTSDTSCNNSTSSNNCSTRMSPFNAQEILSGLPGIEITKVDKNTKCDLDNKKCHTAEVSIIPANGGGEKFNFDKDDLHYDNVFSPRDVLEDDMDADERELEAFKRFCQQSIPPKCKEKVAHLNVKDIVLKKKTADKVTA